MERPISSPLPEVPAPLLLKTDTRGRVRTPVERREALLDELERSGMTGQAFAQWAGIKYPTLAAWRKKRRVKRGSVGQSGGGLSINLVEAVVAGAESRSGAMGGLIVHLPGGLRVECGSAEAAVEFVRVYGARGC